MSVTQGDVARRAGVSRRTVSNVVNGYVHVSDDVRTRVLAAVEELGYRPHHAARSLRTGRSGLIGLAVPELAVDYFAELARSVITAAEARGYPVLLMQTLGDRTRELEVIEGFDRRLTDGLILSPIACREGDIEDRHNTSPILLLGEHQISGVDHVGIDNAAAARDATTHLVDTGRRRIAFVGASRSSEMADLRLSGYRAALDAAGLPFRPELVRTTGGYHRGHGRVAMESLLADEPGGFDAVFCVNDMLAHGAMRALYAAGLRIPADVAVMGFDDIEESSYGYAPLSTVAPDKAAIARAAVERLLSRVDGTAGPPQDVSIPYALMLRESTTGANRPT